MSEPDTDLRDDEWGPDVVMTRWGPVQRWERSTSPITAGVKIDTDHAESGVHETAIEHLNSELVELAAKLDADGGVTDTDYEEAMALGSSAITSTDVVNPLFATDFEGELDNSDAPITSTTTVDQLSRP